jgi:uncharacterized protein with GYD domain
MSTYICLISLTEQGIKDTKNIPQMVENLLKSFETTGCKVIGWYVVMGAYDLVAIIDMPADEIMMSFLFKVSETGMVRTTTLKAFTLQEFT